MATSPRPALERLLRPRSVAIVGASPDPASIGGAPLALIDQFGWAGELHLVSRRHPDIGGRRCVEAVDDLPAGIDAAVLAVPRDAVAPVLDACIRRGIGGVVAFASGFAETGPEGERAQRELAARARAAGVALAGPNCLGVVNFVDGIPLTFGAVAPAPPAGRPALAIVAQSGAMSFALLYAAASDGIPLSYVASTGNEAVLGVEDYLEALIAEPATRTIALLVEQIRDPARFVAAARAARAAGVALCLLHTGTSARGRAAARTHTGALAGEQAVLRAVLAREAVVVVDSLDELIDAGGALTRCPRPTRRGVGFLTDSGALKAHALDVCDRLGLDVPEPTAGTERALRDVLPPFATASNPVDITGHALNEPSLYASGARALLDDPAIGALVVAAMPGSPLQFQQQVDALLPVIEAATTPVLYCVLGGQRPLPAAELARLRAAGGALFRSPERALTAVRHLLDHGRDRDGDAPAPAPAALELPARPTEHETKRLLARLGLPSPAGRLATTVTEARRIAAEIGYPVALKAQTAALVHKSDAGGVIIGIAGDGELARAWALLHADVGRAHPALVLDGVLVERMAPPGVEVVVAGRRDPQWGAAVMVGLGGIWIEALDDLRVIAAAASAAEVRHELAALRGYPVLAGGRGRPAADVDALVDAVLLVAAALRASPDIRELEINPLLVLPVGDGVLALDAVLVREPATTGREP
jgi:acyl-CoA synthetase (NDP forming)